MSKRGRLSEQEKVYIKTNTGKMAPNDIAIKLNRTVETVIEFAKLHVVPDAPTTNIEAVEVEKIVIRQELRNSEAWKNLKEEFVPEELKYFEESYIKLMSQFKGDVLPSEETQILQAIKFEMLMSRNLKERKKAREDISRLEDMQKDLFRKQDGSHTGMSADDRDQALSLESQLNVARAAEQMRTSEYVKLQERHEALMKSLKAIRDQRVKQFENSKVSFLSVLKMLQDRDVQEREGRHIALTKLAGEKEYQRLGRPIKFDDGNEDSPILSADTVNLGKEELENVE